MVSASGMTISLPLRPEKWTTTPTRAARPTDIAQLTLASASGRPRMVLSLSS